MFKLPTQNLGYGISVLHAWNKSLECLLHLSYKIPIQKWQARGMDKEVIMKRKKEIQEEFKRKTGLIVDQPKPGMGNYNDENTARRFFSNFKLSSEITKIDKHLIKNIYNSSRYLQQAFN